MKCAYLIILILVCFLNVNTAATGNNPGHKPGIKSGRSLRTKQLLVVLTNDWTSLKGTLFCFSKHHGKWDLEFSNSIVVGSQGLGIGEGLVPLSIAQAPIKKEGDLKSPAGIFSIGTAFGYASSENAKWIRNPYIRATDTLICVDDLHSAHYNNLVNNDSATGDWKSFEYMHRKDNFYKWGLFINHNAGNPIAGKGSCIFMHIWENDHVGTDGCTAMKEEDMIKVLHWINVLRKPLLIQVPKTEYAKLALQYDLPKVGELTGPMSKHFTRDLEGLDNSPRIGRTDSLKN
jgi:L,D-peptidoglycan transpeptidase YkuD (ErfK/YbiS/YcfS/YnhG family)